MDLQLQRMLCDAAWDGDAKGFCALLGHLSIVPAASTRRHSCMPPIAARPCVSDFCSLLATRMRATANLSGVRHATVVPRASGAWRP